MAGQPAIVHLSVLATAFGDSVDLADLEDADVRDRLDVLREQGYRRVRVAAGSTSDLALAVMPQAPGWAGEGPEFDVVIVCTDATESLPPGEWSASFQAAAGLDSTSVMLLTGTACANVVLGIEAARGLIASGVADNVLLVLVERVVSGSRYTPVSHSVYSDAAAACLVSRHPTNGSYRVLGSAMETRPTRDGEWNQLADARSTVLALSRAAKRAIGDLPADRFAHLLTLNIGLTARRLLSMATRVPPERAFTGPVAEFGHCFAADIPINLQALERSGALADDAHVLALASSRVTLGALALAWGPGAEK